MPSGHEHIDSALMPHLLLVEDNPLHVRLVRTMINDVWPEFDNLDHVARLELGIKRVAEQRPDCILLDLVLPDADGLEAVRAMLSVAPTVSIEVLSAHDDEAMAAEAVREGAQDYLVKGTVSAEGLARAIRFAIERHRSSGRDGGMGGPTGNQHATAVLDVMGGVIVADNAFADMVGRSMSDIVGRSIGDWAVEGDRPRFEKILDSTEESMLRMSFNQSDGTGVTTLVRFVPLADESGPAAAFLATFRVEKVATGAQPSPVGATA